MLYSPDFTSATTHTTNAIHGSSIRRNYICPCSSIVG